MDKHNLVLEFPEFKEKIHLLKTTDSHFKKFFDEYHDLDKEIHSIETGATATTDEHLNELRKKRVLLKDSLYTILNSN